MNLNQSMQIMENADKGDTKLAKLQQRIAELEKIDKKHKIAENELKAYNEQLKLSGQEITQQKQTADQARDFAESIIGTIRQPLLILDANLHVVAANQYFYRTFHVSESETKGRLLYELGNNQWDIPKLKELLKKTLPEGLAVEDFEVEHTFDDIGHKVVLLNACELKQKQGKQRLILLAFEDITSQRKAEKELKWLNKELEMKAEELQQIIYITTHDLRSPLVNIQGFTKEMKASLDELKRHLEETNFNSGVQSAINMIIEEEIPEAIHFITSSTTKMDNLLQGLLSLSRLSRQKMTFRKLDMNQLMIQVLENYKFEINNNNVEVVLHNLPFCTGDELQINQLFSNLVGNSVKFLDPDRSGKIVISGKKEKTGCTCIIEDNGIGIPKEHQKKIFGLFEKLNPQKPGTGLGMNIVKQIVDRHNGTLELDSELGKGTRIRIFIPD